MSSIRTETETVIKKILPYLERRGYDLQKDIDFETATQTLDRYTKGYIDLLIFANKKTPAFLIEAKRISKTLTTKDRDQAINYARTKEVNVPFVVVTNGKDIHCYNTKNKIRILWDGKRSDKIPSKAQLDKVLRALKTNPDEVCIGISNDESLPFRQGLALRQLNALFAKGHNTIRKIEKDEEYAFADFSKLLFLKLLEEKDDLEEDFKLPYTYRFHELAEYPNKNADQVKTAVESMIGNIIRHTTYGEVLKDPIKLENPKTYLNLVKDLASVSFCDCSVDSKGAAFEYYVRATLKGKKLGQYFTPRELVQVMMVLVGQNKIINSVLSNSTIKVLDPACGTGGFLVFLMQDSIEKLQKKLSGREITKETFDNAVKKIKETVFFGSDANKGVAASAKMNMIIAGDGHTNIQHEDSLSLDATNWNIKEANCNLIMTNPPFGTSEGDSLTSSDSEQYDVSSSKGQYLFLQKMIKCTVAGGEICTVIDEGVLNTDSGKEVRKFILQNCKIKAIVNLPSDTFKPNKINVKSSLLYLEKKAEEDIDLEDNYLITICKLDSLGYYGSGEKIRSFETSKFLKQIEEDLLDTSKGNKRSGYYWNSFDIQSSKVCSDPYHRFDYKYWDVSVCDKIQELANAGCPTIEEINTIETRRGKSPSPDSYVDESEGFALVLKSGSSISKFGTLIYEDSDWIEKSLYDEFFEKSTTDDSYNNLVTKGDVLLASTGEGTLGKCCVYELDVPAIADGHITIFRVDAKKIDPYYLADYLRNGFGNTQVNRLFTGSTGQIELTPEQANSIFIDIRGELKTLKEQRNLSNKMRTLESRYHQQIKEAEELLNAAKLTLSK